MANCVADPSRECLSLARVEALEKQMDEHKHSASEKHKEFFARIRALEQAKAVQEEQYKTILAKLETVAEAVNILKERPAKRWDSAITAIISALVGGAIGYFVSLL